VGGDPRVVSTSGVLIAATNAITDEVITARYHAARASRCLMVAVGRPADDFRRAVPASKIAGNWGIPRAERQPP